MKPFLYAAMIVVSIGLIALVLLQVKGSSLGGLFGGDGAVYRSKRGVERHSSMRPSPWSSSISSWPR